MPTFFPEEYSSRVREGRISPIVLFSGEEQLLADEAIGMITDALVDEGVRDFNVDVLDGTQATLQDVLERASAYPMMSERRVVVVRRFHQLVSHDAGRDRFEAYLANPSESTCLVLAAAKADLRRRPYTQLKKRYDVVDCKPLPDREIPGWIQGRARKMGKTIDAESAFMLQSYVGNSLLVVVSELEKLISFVGDRKDIRVDDVTEAVGATRGFTIFNLQDAVGNRDYRHAIEIARRIILYGEQAQLIVATLTRFFVQLLAVQECQRKRMKPDQIVKAVQIHPYRARLMMPVARAYRSDEIVGAIHALRGSDRRLKTKDIDPAAEIDLLLHSIIRGNDAGSHTERAGK